MVELVFYIVAFIALSGVMAVVEAAVLSVSPGEVEEITIKRAWGASALRAITQRIARPVVVIVVLTNTINILGPILAGSRAIQLYGDVAIAGVTVVLTLGTIVFSEIIPKSLGSHYAPLISRLVAPTIQTLIYVFYPIVVAFERLSRLFMTGKRRIGTEEQIRSLAKIGRREGYIDSGEGQLIRRAFILNDRTAADIMTPLKDVVGVAEASSIRQAAMHVFRHSYSRYPVFGKPVHDIKGLVMSRDILEAITEGKDRETASSISDAS